MCESKVYILKEGREELALDDVSYLCYQPINVFLH